MIDLSYRDIHGNLKKKQETANSYVISELGEYCFPLVMGNGIKEGKTNLSSFTNQNGNSNFYNYLNKIITSPELIGGKSVSIISWDSSREFIKDLRVEEDYIKFLITNVPENGANYVIGIKDSNDVIMWSWHLWLWKKKFEDIEIGKYKILNTNLATKENKSWLYQWGRKDPLSFLNKSRFYVNSVHDIIGKCIQHPNIFYTENLKLRDYNWAWKFLDNYWNSSYEKYQINEKITKTIYDPCPQGYHVPSSRVFQLLKDYCFDKNKKGMLFNNKLIFFPSQKYRNYTNGLIVGNGEHGYYWSCNPENNNTAYLLYFSKNQVVKSYTKLRGEGILIRPQKEEN